MPPRSVAFLIGFCCVIPSYAGSVCTPSPLPPCGQQLAVYPSVDGAAALSNGLNQDTGCSCAGSNLYQCVEYVKRYYATVMNYPAAAQWHGDAHTYFSTAAAKGLQSFPNGSPTVPATNDILVFDGDTYGHVAIVTAVTTTQMTIIEQNWSRTGIATLPIQYVNGGYQVGPRPNSHYVVLGWLRLPATTTTKTFTDRSSFLAVTSGLTTIDFEGLAPFNGGTNYSSALGLTLFGVTFVGYNGLLSGYELEVVNWQSGSVYNWNSGGVLLGPANNGPIATSYIFVTLPTGTTAVGMDVASVYTTQVSVALATGETITVPTARPQLKFAGFTSSTPITSLKIYGSGTTFFDPPVVDNFAFGYKK